MSLRTSKVPRHFCERSHCSALDHGRHHSPMETKGSNSVDARGPCMLLMVTTPLKFPVEIILSSGIVLSRTFGGPLRGAPGRMNFGPRWI